MKLNLKEFEQYEAVIGLEVHVQLSTNSKAFCSDSASFGSQPNQDISTVSLGLPGALPVCNEKIIAFATKLGLAINCEINQYNFFDRKNYFYADLPKGYQITQDNRPICVGGKLKIRLDNGVEKDIILNRIHIEEDAGKSNHDLDAAYSFIDLNRAGVPLLEVVTEPMIASGEEAAAYLSELRKLVRYLDICDGNMEEGSMRCDANISIRLKGDTKLGNRCEVKNLNSIKNVQKAIEHEIDRQIRLVIKGETISQNTLNFDAVTGKTSPLRSKEMANDYRYFPEPDLLPIVISDEFLEKVKTELPALPEELYQKFVSEMGLSAYDALVLTAEKETANYFIAITEYTKAYKTASNWIMGPIKSYLNEKQISFTDFLVPSKQIAEIINLLADKSINHHQAKDKLFNSLIENPSLKVADLMQNLGLGDHHHQDELSGFITTALNKYPDKVKEYHNGKKGVLGLFMGEVMKLSHGKCDPKKTNQLIIQKIESLK
ncbi:aspartyl/glutamyl-tRNA amidotransferase subunit B [Pedobacter psychrophilus]|uniref:Aspartyl/glutamyl-tRNA(Asn/Gln) amidotransferase subunit B n=1 Tax=Pedobacter psychrophilus TaxID=1826909 RepID=A0A179DAQ7_9SPHI|nr:Asp-tRNA(Asn)/Glu-tRNA(Gln) amidotransferase subunit GatB [Pedobacter psychrophilus]OAQ38078.1 aspartyl/glutamyl-tRNA amidotransferase subunit B [Pedobacter psychrophilus]